MKRYLINLFKNIKFLLNYNFVWHNPTSKKILVFDDVSYSEIKDMIKRYDHYVLAVRKENIKQIYISFKIIFLTIYYYRGNLFSSYLISLIMIVNPKIVFTFIDNSFKFMEIAKYFKKINRNIKFVALQNGARYEPLEYEYLFNSRINNKNLNYSFYLPILFSFGLYEKDLFKKKKVNFKKIIPVGNLRLENYLIYKNKVHLKFKKKKQICFLSEHNNWNKKIELLDKNFVKNYFRLLNFSLRYAKENKYKIIICSKRYKGNSTLIDNAPHHAEIQSYEKFVKNEYKKLFKSNLIKRNIKDRFQTYKNMEESEITIGTMSTLLRENLFLKNKIFACNTSKINIYDFPLKDFFSSSLDTYNLFEKKINNLINMPKKKYFDNLKNKIYYLSNNKISTRTKIYSTLDEILKSS